MDYRTSMTEGSIWKKMLLFCIPLIMGNLFQYLYSTVDSIIVGRLVGETALAAVGACEPIISFIIGLCSGVSGGAGVIISQFYGAKNEKDFRRTIHTAISLGAIMGLVIQVATILLTPVVLRAINTPDDVIDQAILYLQTYFGGMCVTLLFYMAAGILNAVGNSKMTLLYQSIASVMNIVLDLVFVIVFDWGIFGAAFATVLSQIFSCVCALIYLFRCRESIYRLDIRALRVDKELTVKVLKLGIPSSVQNMVRCFANILVQAGINGFGAMAMAGYAAYLRVDNIIWLPLMSMGMAASTFTGQNIGAQKYDRVKKGMFVSVTTSAVFTAAISVILIIVREPVIRLFNENPEVVKYGVITLMGYIPLYFTFAIYNTLAGTITGAGRTFEAMCVSIGAMCLFRIVLLSIVTKIGGSFALLMSIFPVTWTTAMFVLIIYMWKADWMHPKNKELRQA